MRLLIFGDSIAEGNWDTENGGWVSQLFSYCLKKVEGDDDYVTPLNLSISGDCTNRVLERFVAEADVRTKEKQNSAHILFAIGVNDTQRYVEDDHIKTPLGTFKENLEMLHKQAEEYGGKVVFTGILPINESIVQPMPWADDRYHTADDIKLYDGAIESFCKDKECLFIPMQDLFLESDPDEYLEDGIHPNAHGHKRILARVTSMLEGKNII